MKFHICHKEIKERKKTEAKIVFPNSLSFIGLFCVAFLCHFQYYILMCIFLAKYLFWHCCCYLLSSTKCSQSVSIDFFTCPVPLNPFSSLFLSLTLILLLCMCVNVSYILYLAPFYVKYIEHSFDIILSIFCMSWMLLL